MPSAAAPAAFIGMLEGRNFGKALVHVARWELGQASTRHHHSKEALNMTDRSKSTKPTMIECWNEHMAQEFVHKDVDATMRTMTVDPHVISVPVATGGR